MLKYTALITQTIDCTSARSGEGSLTPSTSALCTPPVRPSPPSPSRKTCRGVPVRPQLLSSAVFSCLLHRRVIRTPHPHTRAHSTWVADPSSPPSGRAVGGGTAPDLRRPSQWWKAPPPGDALPPPPQRATPARKGARCGAGAGSPRPHRPHPGHTGRGASAARSRGRAPGEGQRLTPDAPHNSGNPPPRGRPPTTPAARSPHRACRPRGQCWAPTPTHPRPQHVGGGPRQPAQWAGSRGRDSA